VVEPILPSGVEAIKYKLPAVKLYKPEGNVRLVRGDEAKEVIAKTLSSLYSSSVMSEIVNTPRNVYYRVYKSGEGYGVFYLFEWGYQAFPPHKYDYEPVIVLTDKDGNPKEVYVDGYHYFISKYSIPRGTQSFYLYSDTPWRSMKVKFGAPSNNEVELYPENEKLERIGPTPKYLSDKIIAKLKSRTENPLKVNDKLIKDPWSVREAKHWTTYNSPTPEDFMYDIAENYGLAKYIKGPMSLNAMLTLMKAKITIENLVSKVESMLTSVINNSVKEKEKQIGSSLSN